LLPAGAIAGWDFHPLESAAFARRTPIADTLHCEREDMNFGFFVQQLAEFFAMHLARPFRP
jgi:hypothetical protein